MLWLGVSSVAAWCPRLGGGGWLGGWGWLWALWVAGSLRGAGVRLVLRGVGRRLPVIVVALLFFGCLRWCSSLSGFFVGAVVFVARVGVGSVFRRSVFWVCSCSPVGFFPLLCFPSFLLSPCLWSLPVCVCFGGGRLVGVVVRAAAVPLGARVAAGLAAGAVLLGVAARPAAGGSAVGGASPGAGVFGSGGVGLVPGL